MDKIAHILVEKAVQLGVIEAEKSDIYEYGVADFLYTLLTWIVFLIIGLLANVFWYMLLFMIAYSPLRMFSGGIHCKTRVRCLIVSFLITAVVFSLPQVFDVKILTMSILVLLLPNIFVVKLLAPVEDARKPLNRAERDHYGKAAFTITLICSGIVVLLVLLHYPRAAYYIGAASAVTSVQLVQGFMVNKLRELPRKV